MLKIAEACEWEIDAVDITKVGRIIETWIEGID
jgi:hypothetical protein